MIYSFSVSRMKLFEACRMAYKFKYIEGLEPVQKADALQTGLNYHAKLEELYKTGEVVVENFDKETAMALAYQKYIYPQFKVNAVEESFEYDLGGYKLIGRVDGIAEDGRLVEHKTTSMDLGPGGEYEYNLQWDQQILAYMLAKNIRSMWYTVIKKPNIRLKKNETDEEFFDRMVAWYDEDTDSKIMLLEVTRTDQEIEEFRKYSKIMAEMMANAEAHPDALIYRNPAHCNCWGRRCEYSSICLNYDPQQQYIEFTRRDEQEGKNG